MPRIYVDLDDVLAQTGRMFLGLLEREFGRTVAFEQIHSYHLGESFSLAPAELAEFMRLAHEPEALGGVEPMPGAAEALGDWLSRGYQVFVVTGRPLDTMGPSLDWLVSHAIPFSELHHLDKYSQFYGGAHGAPGAGLSLADLPGLDFCLAIEDFPDMTVHLAQEVGVPVALFDRPWNRLAGEKDASSGAPVVRCEDWAEIRRRFPDP